MTAQDILIEARRLGVRVTPYGPNNLYVDSDTELPPDFEQVLRDNKPGLLRHLRNQQASVRHLARQVVENEFVGANSITLHRVTMELRENITDPLCRRALDRLQHQSQRHGEP